MWHAVQVSLQVGKVRWLPLLLLFLFLLTACCMWHVAVASIRSRRCATNKLRMRSHHMEVGQVPHRPGQHNIHTHTCAQRKRCCDVKSCDCDCDCVCVAGHANSRVFVGQHFRLRSGGGFNAIWGLWSWPPPNQTSFKCAVVTARLHLLLLFSVFFLSALSAAANEFLRSVGDVRCAYRYICIFADSCALAYSILVQQYITHMQNTQMQNMKCIKYSIVKY